MKYSHDKVAFAGLWFDRTLFSPWLHFDKEISGLGVSTVDIILFLFLLISAKVISPCFSSSNNLNCFFLIFTKLSKPINFLYSGSSGCKRNHHHHYHIYLFNVSNPFPKLTAIVFPPGCQDYLAITKRFVI